MADTPNIQDEQFASIPAAALFPTAHSTHAPRILVLYGSLRERSFSRFAAEEAARILTRFGAEVRIFNPAGLPLVDETGADHPKVAELRDLVSWCEGWCGPRPSGMGR